MATPKIIIKGSVLVKGAPDHVVCQLQKELTFKNPKYEQAIKTGRYLDPVKTPQFITFYKSRGSSIIIPKALCAMACRLSGLEQKDVVDYTVSPEMKVKHTGTPRKYQQTAITSLLGRRYGMLDCATGGGKCLGKNTPVVMYNGKIEKVQNIKNGDLVMGPDSKPRKVSGVVRGEGPLFKVIPIKGEPFVCNDVHVLSLQKTGVGNQPILDVPLDEYLKWNKTQKHLYKLYKPEGIKFKKVKVPIDPYIVGVYLGDGTKTLPAITLGTKKHPIVNYLLSWIEKNKYRVREQVGTNCTMFHILNKNSNGSVPNKFRNFCKEKCLTEKKERNIPTEYLINTKKVRMRLLAGLLDTDGYLHRNTFEITCKDEHFANQICFLCRSLGFRALKSNKIATIKTLNFTGLYYRISISGDTRRIPTKVKKAPERKQKISVLKTGFSVEPLGNGNYYGFALNKDHRFLLGDFTITHNTFIGTTIATERGVRTLVVVHSKELLGQWVAAFKEFTDVEEVGTIGGGAKENIQDITVGIVNSVANRVDYIYKEFGLVIYDECHRTASPVWMKVISGLQPKFHLGLTATPYRSDGLTKALFRIVGPIVHKVNRKHLEKTKAILTPTIVRVVTRFNHRFNNDYSVMLTKLTANDDRNIIIGEKVVKDYDEHKEPIMVVSDRVSHCKVLHYMLSDLDGIHPVMLHGQLKKSERDTAVQGLRSGKFNIVIATAQLIGEGFDLDSLNVICLTTPMKFSGRVLQSVGRILRPSKTSTSTPRVYDFRDVLIPVLRNSGFARDRVYKKYDWR